MSWKIDEATDAEIIASKPQGSLADVSALLRYVARELGLFEGVLEHGGLVGGVNRARITPLKGKEEAFAEALKKYNESKAGKAKS